MSKTVNHKFLSRRTLLRGLAAGSSLAISVPLLDAMLDRNGEAFAEGDPLPMRYGVWFLAGGIHQGWAPSSTGALQLGPEFDALQRFSSKLTFVGGLGGPSFGNYAENRHLMGTAGGLSGHRPANGAFTAKSFDQVIADGLGTDGIHSLQVGVYPYGTSETGTGWEWISHTGENSPNPAEFDPSKVYARLFSALVPPDPAKPALDQNALRASYLDAVLADSRDLSATLGSGDKLRLDAFLEGLFELESQLGGGGVEGPVSQACVAPSEGNVGADDFEATNRAMSKLVAMALACRLTNVFAFQYTKPNAFIKFPGMPDSHHNLGHVPQKSEIGASTAYAMSQFGVLLEEMDALSEGSGTVLDHSAVLVQSDTSWDHDLSNMVAIVAGKAGGALAGGRQVVTQGPMTRLALTAGRALGADIASMGQDDGYAAEAINEILA